MTMQEFTVTVDHDTNVAIITCSMRDLQILGVAADNVADRFRAQAQAEYDRGMKLAAASDDRLADVGRELSKRCMSAYGKWRSKREEKGIVAAGKVRRG